MSTGEAMEAAAMRAAIIAKEAFIVAVSGNS
jgi:hypothetical protein